MSQFENINTNSFEELDEFIRANFNVVDFINGHVKDNGRYSGIEKNPIWKIDDNGNDSYSEFFFCYYNYFNKFLQSTIKNNFYFCEYV